MGSLFGDKKPTQRYPRLVWNGITLDLEEPLSGFQPEERAVIGGTIAASGLRETIYERMDGGATLILGYVKPHEMAGLQRWFRSWAGPGEQFELYVDRYLRACWAFAGESVDNNGGNAFAAPNGTLSYVSLTNGLGVTVPIAPAGVLSAALISTLPGGGGNAFFQPSEGTLVLHIKPAFAGADSIEHVLADCAVESDLGRNRLLIKKRADNLLHVIYHGANGAATIREVAAAWSPNTEHTLVVQWGAILADFRATLDGTEITTTKYFKTYGSGTYGDGVYGQVAGSTPSGNEQLMTSGPTRLALGSDVEGIMGRSTGSVGFVALYSAAYGLSPLVASDVRVQRSYYPRAELLDAGLAPARISPGTEAFSVQLRIRDGR